jgi:hypothetical protein
MTANQNAKIEQLRNKRAALDARIEKLIARESAAHRKQRTRALVLIGAALESEIKADLDALSTVRQVVSERLTSPRDRQAALAYLDVLHEEAKPQ